MTAMTPKLETALEKAQELLDVVEQARPGTTLAQASVFIALVRECGDADTPVTQEAIGDRLGSPQGVVSKQLQKFVQAGLLEKENVPGSDLYKQYPLTSKGRSLVNKIKTILAGG